jgi:hypothetical protein
MTLLEIIKEKNKRLVDIPEKFLSRVEKAQKEIYAEIIAKLSNLERSGDHIVMSVKNLRLADKINDELSQVLFGSDYLESIKEFAAQFDQQKDVNDKYFKKAFPDFKQSDLADAIFQQTKTNAVDLLAGSTVETAFLEPLKQQIDMIVSSGTSWKEAVDQLRAYALGDGEVDGKLLKYSKQIATDSLAISDRSYTSAVADQLGSEWFLYSGDVLLTSRCFCIERHAKYYHYKEIESWGRGENLGDCNTGDGDWAGKNVTTNEQTIYNFAGGWNCNHSIMPVTIDLVPLDVIHEAMDKWGFEPTQFDRDELGI